MTEKSEIGKCGEELACRHLKSNGYSVIARNFSCRSGEIDIIASKGNTLAFVEVKTRSRTDMGLPCQAVNCAKQKKIKKTAAFFLLYAPQLSQLQPRFDIAEVLFSGGKIFIRHLENAF